MERALPQMCKTQNAPAEPEELMALETPRKQGDKVTYPGEFVMTVFGCPPVKGRQGFWFFDPKVAKRVRLPITDQSKSLSADLFRSESWRNCGREAGKLGKLSLCSGFQLLSCLLGFGIRCLSCSTGALPSPLDCTRSPATRKRQISRSA